VTCGDLHRNRGGKKERFFSFYDLKSRQTGRHPTLRKKSRSLRMHPEYAECILRIKKRAPIFKKILWCRGGKNQEVKMAYLKDVEMGPEVSGGGEASDVAEIGKKKETAIEEPRNILRKNAFLWGNHE